MIQNRIIDVGSTGLWPVVSGVAPETVRVTGTICTAFSKTVHHSLAGKIRRDAGFNGRDARSTTIFA